VLCFTDYLLKELIFPHPLYVLGVKITRGRIVDVGIMQGSPEVGRGMSVLCKKRLGRSLSLPENSLKNPFNKNITPKIIGLPFSPIIKGHCSRN
jgi:hypothetical protein